MQKSFSKILTSIFLLIFIFQLASLIFLLAVPSTSQAASVNFTPQVGVGNFEKGVPQPVGKSTEMIGEYIREIYKYALGIVGILATVVLMFGGVLWITAGGNAERITNAKSWIGASLTGLVLALTSYMILYFVNPGLVNFRVTPVTPVKENNTSGWYFSWHNPISNKSGNSKFYKTLAKCKEGEKKDTHIYVTITMPCRNDSVAMFSYSWGCIPQGKSCMSTLGSGWMTAPHTQYCTDNKTCPQNTTKTCCRKRNY